MTKTDSDQQHSRDVYRSAESVSAVSQDGSLRIVPTPADCQSATQQTDSLRYGGFAAQLMAGLLILATLGPITSPSAEGPAIVSRGPHSREWQRSYQESLPNGKVRTRTTSFTELATGMHRWDAQANQWVESRDTIEIFEGGAVARQGAHQVIFAPNANTAGAVDLLTPDGVRLRSHVIGIAVYDPKTGESEMIGSIKDSVGELHPPNVVVYKDIFEGVSADLRYTYRIGGFEQDVILTEQIAMPEDWDPGSVVIQVWSEFLDGHTPAVVPGSRAGLAHDTILFGALQTGAGHAFALGDEEQRVNSTPVAARWVIVEGRTFIVESIRYNSLKKDTQNLPLRQARAQPPPGRGRQPRDFCPFPSLPPTREARAAKPTEGFRTVSIPTTKSNETAKNPASPKPDTGFAAAPLQAPGRATDSSIRPWRQQGYVIDYQLTASLSNFTFRGDETYTCSNAVTLAGTTTWEGNCVIKFARTNIATLSVVGTDVWDTGMYRPALFTAADDNSVGTVVGTGSPTGYYGGKMLYFNSASGGHPSNVRFSYAATAVAGQNPTSIRHAQFVHCNKAIEHNSASGSITNENVLFYDISTLYQGGSYFLGKQLTIHKCTNFSAGGDYSGELLNSLVIGLNSWGPFEISQTSCYVSGADDPNAFSVVGAAAHYLATNSVHRNAGGVLSGPIANDIRQRTTYPPIVIDASISIDTTLSPQAQRDTDLPDRGYHYDPLDFAMRSAWMDTHVSLTILPGTAISVCGPSVGSGLTLLGGCRLDSRGTPEQPVRFVRHTLVQEQANTNWTGAGPMFMPNFSSVVAPELKFRFTEFAVSAADMEYFGGYYSDGPVAFTDCRFYGGTFWDMVLPLAATNCLFHRLALTLDDYTVYNPFEVQVRNCLFVGGKLDLSLYEAGSLWAFQNNLFDRTLIVTNTGTTNGYNAYTTNVSRLWPITAGDILLATSNITYQTWGANTFYLPTNSPLVNAGSTWATNVGLYHFTTTTNQVKEAASQVDIGFHYATVTNGVPIDTDGDGMADYFEDVNGNGSLDSGETATTSATDWGLKVYITKPRKGSNIP